ncbi:hypothetical protein CES86_0378 [Brucella lupini]|uniref:Uncharacterized protein n=1 Tax=Brucella lupini TaxID=255457 RepID=A0A256GXX8_9HYPH|nr:hypothetical protein CES86_0378 [Brucella lupini]
MRYDGLPSAVTVRICGFSSSAPFQAGGKRGKGSPPGTVSAG